MVKSKEVKTEHAAVRCTQQLSATEDALYVLGGKWTLRIIIAILNGHTRFNDLQRTIKGISARVLSSELKDLELNELIKREVLADQKPVVTDDDVSIITKLGFRISINNCITTPLTNFVI